MPCQWVSAPGKFTVDSMCKEKTFQNSHTVICFVLFNFLKNDNTVRELVDMEEWARYSKAAYL